MGGTSFFTTPTGLNKLMYDVKTQDLASLQILY